MQILKSSGTYLIILLAIIVSSCGSSNNEGSNSLLGKWTTKANIILELKENGKAIFNGTPMKYALGHDSIVLTKEDKKIGYHYALKNNSLEITGGELSEPLVFTKSEGAGILSEANTKKDDATTSTDAAPNTNTTSTPSTNADASQKSATQGAENTTSQSIYDTWISAQETIELKADGNCIYAGQAYKFKYTGSQLILTTPNGDVPMACALSGNQLTLTTNQGAFVYQRKGTKATAASSGGTRGKGQELAGNWCYMSNSKNISFNDCFTIYANGTYSAKSDNSMSATTGSVAENSNDYGTWTYDGTTIFVQSKLHGAFNYPLQKTYNKNGDPCIVIGGKTYFCTTQHARW